MSDEAWTPSKAAFRLTKILQSFSEHTGAARFPIDVPALAKETANIFNWRDPISVVESAPITGFEGALIANDDRSEWMILYNDTLMSEGRVRFTQAHELGHYIVHRQLSNAFQCTEEDMIFWEDERDIEAEADSFAAQLLMPLDDFRQRMSPGASHIDTLGECAEVYGVSLTAAIHRWLEYTEQSAVLVVSRDGFINYAKSSKRAMKAGAYFTTKGRPPYPVPDSSLAADELTRHDRQGQNVAARIWFPRSDEDFTLREMKLTADRYDSTLTLLVLPQSARAWPRWNNE